MPKKSMSSLSSKKTKSHLNQYLIIFASVLIIGTLVFGIFVFWNPIVIIIPEEPEVVTVPDIIITHNSLTINLTDVAAWNVSTYADTTKVNVTGMGAVCLTTIGIKNLTVDDYTSLLSGSPVEDIAFVVIMMMIDQEITTYNENATTMLTPNVICFPTLELTITYANTSVDVRQLTLFGGLLSGYQFTPSINMTDPEEVFDAFYAYYNIGYDYVISDVDFSDTDYLRVDISYTLTDAVLLD